MSNNPNYRHDPLARDMTGKVHGDLPLYVPPHWTSEEIAESIRELQGSIARRKQEQIDKRRPLGGDDEPNHRRRLTEEENFLRQLRKKQSGT
jgi:hypothetical protein